jgi:hypothetical protein
VLPAYLHDRGRNFVSGDPGVRDHRVFPTKRIQVASTQSNHADPEEEASFGGDRFGKRFDHGLPRLFDYERFHRGTFMLLTELSVATLVWSALTNQLLVDLACMIIGFLGAYRCLYAEVEHGSELFVLSSGKWYAVKADFVGETNAAYDRIPKYEGTFPEFKDESEGHYLKRLVASDPKRFVLMDQKMLSYGGGHSQVEFCDLLTSDDDVLHVKRYGQSSTLSHLFAQGLVSGELFQMDATFREEINKKLPRGHKFQNPRLRPKQGQFRVVFAIISDRRGELRLPFFSRLNLKHAARRLEAYGFRVARAKIDVNEVFSKTAKFRSRNRT